MSGPSDQRKVDYLRISVTDRCNFRCRYCMPPEGVPPVAHGEILSFEEILEAARVAVGAGFVRFRLTGGEPLVRRGLAGLVRGLAGIPGVEDLSLTTNGSLLEGQAEVLREAGLDRLNISLDALDPEVFFRLTRGGNVFRVLAGVAAARRSGFPPPRLNAVIVRGFNQDQVIPLVEYARREGLVLRFIEMMPLAPAFRDWESVSGAEVRSTIEARWPLRESTGEPGGGPARYFRGDGFTVGFISPLTGEICSRCNRMRLTADGRLRPCLAAETEFNLKEVLRGGGDVAEVFRGALAAKPPRHCFDLHAGRRRGMSAIGG